MIVHATDPTWAAQLYDWFIRAAQRRAAPFPQDVDADGAWRGYR